MVEPRVSDDELNTFIQRAEDAEVRTWRTIHTNEEMLRACHSLRTARTQTASDAAEIARLTAERDQAVEDRKAYAKDWKRAEAALAAAVTVDIRAIAFTAMQGMRDAGESREMCARWISERVRAAFTTSKTGASDQPEEPSPNACLLRHEGGGDAPCPTCGEGPCPKPPQSDDQACGGEGPKGGPLVQLLSDTLDRIYDVVRAEFNDLYASRPAPDAVRILVEALRELSQTDGSSANVADAEVLAMRVRSVADFALTRPAVLAALSGDPWRPIATAPKNRDIWTFTRTRTDGREIIQKAHWNQTLWINPDTLRTIYPQFWYDGAMPLPSPPAQEAAR